MNRRTQKSRKSHDAVWCGDGGGRWWLWGAGRGWQGADAEVPWNGTFHRLKGRDGARRMDIVTDGRGLRWPGRGCRGRTWRFPGMAPSIDGRADGAQRVCIVTDGERAWGQGRWRRPQRFSGVARQRAAWGREWRRCPCRFPRMAAGEAAEDRWNGVRESERGGENGGRREWWAAMGTRITGVEARRTSAGGDGGRFGRTVHHRVDVYTTLLRSSIEYIYI